MLIKQLNIFGFRNIDAVSLTTDRQVNVFFGRNGSGKTSILESLYYLSRAKSFRTNKKQELIKTDQTMLAVNVELFQQEREYKMGIGLDDKGTSRLKLDGELLNKLSDASLLTPTQIITPESFDIFWSSPKSRRSFLDFGLFHVEPVFKTEWQVYTKQLKQTNALLKSAHSDLRELEYWYSGLIDSGNKIDNLREEFLSNLFSQAIKDLCLILSDSDNLDLLKGLEVRYKKRSPRNNDEHFVLKNLIEKDKRYKQVSFGPSRADLIFIKNDEDISSKLSRGQSKMLFYLLEVAMVNIVRLSTGKNMVMLVDDLPSEVDEQTRSTMLEMLIHSQAQIFVTGIESKIAMEFMKYTDSVNVFHVEHGVAKIENMEQLCP